jgi:hypothetical protein
MFSRRKRLERLNPAYSLPEVAAEAVEDVAAAEAAVAEDVVVGDVALAAAAGAAEVAGAAAVCHGELAAFARSEHPLIYLRKGYGQPDGFELVACVFSAAHRMVRVDPSHAGQSERCARWRAPASWKQWLGMESVSVALLREAILQQVLDRQIVFSELNPQQNKWARKSSRKSGSPSLRTPQLYVERNPEIHHVPLPTGMRS